MSRRNNTDEYPEHLNPFREENGDEDHFQKKFNTIGRRNSRISLNVASWSLFQTIKAKPVERDGTFFQRSSRTKFMSMTPKISRHFAEILSAKRNTNRNTPPTPNPVSNRDLCFSPSEFRIMPKSSREKFAMRPDSEQRVYSTSPSSPESEMLPTAPRSRSLEREVPHTPTRDVSIEFESCEEGIKCSSLGAKPKKKRQAPLPPPSPTSSAPSDQEEREPPSPPEEHELYVEIDKN